MKRITLSKILNFFMFSYILSLYLFTYRESLNYISNLLFLLLIIFIGINNILTKRRLIVTKALYIYTLFVLICLISSLYALDQVIALSKVKTLSFIFILMLLIVNYIDKQEKIENIMLYFVYSGAIASIYILCNSDFSVIRRFGDIIGNVNTVGIILGISVSFSTYFLFERKKYLFAFFDLLMVTIIILTGSRTALFFLLINILILLYLRNRKSLSSKFKFFFIGFIVVILCLYVIYNIPLFYQIIGKRIDNIFLYFKGKSINESSIPIRIYMIKAGINMFLKRPLTGYGIDNYRVLFGRLLPGYETYAHNNIIELLVGIGIFGMIMFYMTHYIVLKNILKSCKYTNINYIFKALIISYLILSITTVYYYDKHFSIIIATGSCLNRIYSKKNFVNKE